VLPAAEGLTSIGRAGGVLKASYATRQAHLYQTSGGGLPKIAPDCIIPLMISKLRNLTFMALITLSFSTGGGCPSAPDGLVAGEQATGGGDGAAGSGAGGADNPGAAVSDTSGGGPPSDAGAGDEQGGSNGDAGGNPDNGGGTNGGSGGDPNAPSGGTDPSISDPPKSFNPLVFPLDNPWNQDISKLPVHPNSAAYMATIGLTTGLHPDFGTVWEGAPIGIPYNIVDANTPRVAVEFEYWEESDPGPYPIPLNVLIEGGPDSQGDRHILLIDPAANRLWELFYAWPKGDGTWTAGSGAIFDLTSNKLRPLGWTSADAAGLPIFPGLVRYDEVVERGEIRHALRFTVSRTQRGYILPATHFASSSTDPNRPPMGLRVRLKADYDIGSFSPHVQVILRALKTYGMFVADNGSNWYITGCPDPRWDDDELRALGQVKGSAFEAVYTGEIIKG
jgi:hypothetical protein